MIITVWNKWNWKKKIFDHNHIENGFNINQKVPNAITKYQEKMWKNAKWQKFKAKLINGIVKIKENKMTLDYEIPDSIKLGKDLRPGDCIREQRYFYDMGIIIATTCLLDKRGKELIKSYENQPAFEMYDINCPSDGPYSSHLDLDKEFKVICARKDILYIYEKIEYQLLKRSADLMKQRNNLMKIKNIAVKCMNDRCDKLKEKNE